MLRNPLRLVLHWLQDLSLLTGLDRSVRQLAVPDLPLRIHK